MGKQMSAEVANSAKDSLEVEGEPGVYWCAKHTKVKTRLRCGRCETPICPKCTKMGPTGARCPTCASFKGTHLYQVKPHQYVGAAVVSIVLGMISASIANVASFFAIFYAPLAGSFIAKVISTVSGNKRGTPLAVIASGGLVLGVLVKEIAIPLITFRQPSVESIVMAKAEGYPIPMDAMSAVMANAMDHPFVWLYLLLAVPSVWYWFK